MTDEDLINHLEYTKRMLEHKKSKVNYEINTDEIQKEIDLLKSKKILTTSQDT